MSPIFLDVEDALWIHGREIERSGGTPELRELGELEAAIGAPQAAFGGEYLMDLFDMAATYVVAIAVRHPFLDGNKRTALASALTFLALNGYQVEERRPLELADVVLSVLDGSRSREDVGRHFREHAVPRVY